MQETIEILSDSDLLRDYATGMSELAEGERLDVDQLDEHMRRTGRPPRG